jgi:molecular chaperone DnaJ
MIKDYYQVLEVERDVAPDVLKKAYRSLAHKWHPDKNLDNTEEAEEKFKEISEAYSVLSDPEKKQLYDMTGSTGGFKTTGDPFSMFFGGRFSSHFNTQPNPPMKGQSLRIPLEISLSDALFGGEMLLEYHLQSGCSACGGKGGVEFETCPACGGGGFIQQQRGSMFIQQGCGRCDAQGRVVKTPCSPCEGRGVVPETKKINIVIPTGVKQGNTMRLAGQGGAGFNGGPSGDVMVAIQVNYPDVNGLSGEEKEQLCMLLNK